MAKSIPVGKTPGQQERRQRSAAGTLIMQCTAEYPETEDLHHVPDLLIAMSAYLKNYWWGNWFPEAFFKVPQTLWFHVRLCFKKANFLFHLLFLCSRISYNAMCPRSAGNAASGIVPAGRALMDVKCPKNHRWHLENCNNSCQKLDCGAGSSSRIWQLQIKAVSLCLCLLSRLTAPSSVVPAPLPFSVPVIVTLSEVLLLAFSLHFGDRNVKIHQLCPERISVPPLCAAYLAERMQMEMSRGGTLTPKTHNIKAFSCVSKEVTLTSVITNKQWGLRSITIIVKLTWKAHFRPVVRPLVFPFN